MGINARLIYNLLGHDVILNNLLIFVSKANKQEPNH